MQNLEWYLADLKSMGKNTIETVQKSLTDMFIRLVRIYPCLCRPTVAYRVQIDGINIATELITRYYLNETLIRSCFNVRPTSATLAQH